MIINKGFVDLQVKTTNGVEIQATQFEFIKEYQVTLCSPSLSQKL